MLGGLWELASYHADKNAVPSGYHNTRLPTFSEPDRKRRKSAANLPNLPLRFAFVGTSGSGKGVCMLYLFLRHYKGAFDRINLYSWSASLNKS